MTSRATYWKLSRNTTITAYILLLPVLIIRWSSIQIIWMDSSWTGSSNGGRYTNNKAN